MDSEIDRVYDRLRLHYLIEDHPQWSSESYAQAIGRSARWVRKWQQRFAQASQRTLSLFVSQSRAPKRRPRQTPAEVKTLISDLRKTLAEHYHRVAGSRLILHELEKHRDRLETHGYFVPQSPSTITTILRELGHIQAPQRHSREPIELPAPHEEWEMDFGEIQIDEWTVLEFFVVVDRGTSRVIYLEGSQGYNAETALLAVARLLIINGLPQRLRFDRDPRLFGSWTRDSYPSPLVRFLRVLGIQEVICPPRRPDLKPVIERCIGTLKHEWLARFSINTYADGIDKLPEFLYYHNQERVHFGRACQGQIPDEAFPTLPQLPPVPDQVDPSAWLQRDHQRVFRRRITSNGSFQVDKHRYHVSRKYAHRNVLVYLDAERQQFRIILNDEVIATKPIQGLQQGEMDFQSYLSLAMKEARFIELHRFRSWFGMGEPVD